MHPRFSRMAKEKLPQELPSSDIRAYQDTWFRNKDKPGRSFVMFRHRHVLACPAINREEICRLVGV